MFERQQQGERSILVDLDVSNQSSPEDRLEFRELVRSAGAQECELITGKRYTPEIKYFVGTGKAQEIADAVAAHQASLVIFNHSLTSAQERNLERLCQARVVDRTGLILDIFAQRARTFEGKLQVELAQLKHLSTRLIRGWTHLERQKGGIGLRGPGETQLETDRRLIKQRIALIQQRLEKVRQQRYQSRRARLRAVVPTVALVGYTNAGKSTLFNYLTQGQVYVANQLFATLDPSLKRMILPGAKEAVLADTVGFIKHLPHDLIEAFRATLEEVKEASLLLHVIDISDESHAKNLEAVQEVLEQIGATNVRQILIYNKIDRLSECESKIEHDAQGRVSKIWIAANTGIGIEKVHQAIINELFSDTIRRQLCLLPSEARLRAALYELNAVVEEQTDELGRWQVTVETSPIDFARLFDEN